MKQLIYFSSHRVELSDGGTLYEITTPCGDMVASTEDSMRAAFVAYRLNQLLDEVAQLYPSDFVVNT
jgi:hypothetical protein